MHQARPREGRETGARPLYASPAASEGPADRRTLSDVGDARSSHSFDNSPVAPDHISGTEFPRAVGGMILSVRSHLCCEHAHPPDWSVRWQASV